MWTGSSHTIEKHFWKFKRYLSAQLTFSVIKVRERPAIRLFRVEYLRRNVAEVIMIASNHVPFLLQRWITVNSLERREKSEILNVPHTSVIEVVAVGHEEIYIWNLKGR